MNKQTLFLNLRNLLSLLFLFSALHTNAFNYSVSFIGHGASTNVTSVIVQNITKGTSTIVPAGQVLNFTGLSTHTTNIRTSNDGDIVCFNDMQGNSMISFDVKQAGTTMINAFSLDGRKIAGQKNNLNEGNYRYKMSLPKGVFIIQVSGIGFNYNTKLINHFNIGNDIRIALGGFEPEEKSYPKRAKASGITMEYSLGDRIIFRGESGNMSTIVSDVITADKTIDFNFVACEDANGNHYTTITIGNQVWMAENLKATKYADGEEILLVESKAIYESYPLALRQTHHYCRYFQDNPATKDIGGLAYKHQTIQHKDICPPGWRIPDHFEWRTLSANIATNETERINSIRKTGSGSHWDYVGATNVSGFSAIATGGFWDATAINAGTWALWLANDLFNNDPDNCWFFYVGKHASNPAAIVCEELASSAYDMFGAIRCVRDYENPNGPPFNYSVSFSGKGGAVENVLVQNLTKGTSKTLLAGQVLGLTNSNTNISDNEMFYTNGDRIIFKGESGNMSTLVSDVITVNKTINFDFYQCTDANGNHYSTITIGDQVWMAENLKATKYADGSSISTPRYFNNDLSTLDIGAGMAYNYQTIKDKKIAPVGWHVPDHFEWRTFKDNVDLMTNGNSFNALRKTGPYWGTPGATNASGFSALGTGILWDAAVDNFGTWALWLASDLWNNDPANAWFCKLTSDVFEELATDAAAMFGAIRCLKTQEPYGKYDVLKLRETPISLWVTPPAAYQTSEEYGKIKESGINFVNGFHWSENDNSKILQVLDYCQEHGMKYFANRAMISNDLAGKESNSSYRPNSTALKDFTDGVLPYATHPAFEGELLMDEPTNKQFGALSAYSAAFKQAYPDKIAHVNLFPSHGNLQLAKGQNYVNYIDNWISSEKPTHISFDNYPLLNNNTIFADYFYDMDVVRARSRVNEIPFWTFIQTLRIDAQGKREPNEVDLRWQVWSNLAFGAKGIQYFCYWTPVGGVESFGDALIDVNGQKTVRYDYVKTLNADINSIGKILLDCHADGVIQTATTKLKMYAALTKFGEITSVSGDDNIVGCFNSMDGAKKVLITTHVPTKEANVILNLSNNITQVTVWENNISRIENVANNKLTFKIAKGEAVLVEF